jgi:hypothetical protein
MGEKFRTRKKIGSAKRSLRLSIWVPSAVLRQYLSFWKVRIPIQLVIDADKVVGMDKPDSRCQNLVQTTADNLGPGAVAVMLRAVRGDNVRLNVHIALKRCSVDENQGNADQ